MKTLNLLCAIVLTTGLIGCENSDDNTIASAQQCLDKATTPSVATNCWNMVNGIEKPEAYGIKCAADFIADGITSQRITNAVSKALDGVSGADNAAAIMMMYLTFSTTTKANQAYSDCTKSGSKGYQFFASVAQMGTFADSVGGGAINAIVAGGGTPTGAQIESAINGAIGNPAAESAVGSAAKNMYSSQCATITPQNQAVCNTIKNQVNSGASDQAIGAALLAAFQNPPPP